MSDARTVLAEWPPPLANRATRRHCAHQFKGGYCVNCGTAESSDSGSEQ